MEYTHNQKENLAEQIQKIKKKKDLINIINIIMNDPNVKSKLNTDDQPFVENSNGLHMFFHLLDTSTYQKIEKVINNINNSNTISESNTQSQDSDKQRDYRPYFHDEFPSERNMSPKLRYSNREKSLMKRRKYNKDINNEEEYCDFNVTQSPTI
jgi:hypothetical protein